MTVYKKLERKTYSSSSCRQSVSLPRLNKLEKMLEKEGVAKDKKSICGMAMTFPLNIEPQ